VSTEFEAYPIEIPCAALFLLSRYYYQYVCEIPQLYFHPDSKVSGVVQEHCKSLFDYFRPTPWLWLADAQTLFGSKEHVTSSAHHGSLRLVHIVYILEEFAIPPTHRPAVGPFIINTSLCFQL
jgi:hypothetical protein